MWARCTAVVLHGAWITNDEASQLARNGHGSGHGYECDAATYSGDVSAWDANMLNRCYGTLPLEFGRLEPHTFFFVLAARHISPGGGFIFTARRLISYSGGLAANVNAKLNAQN